MYKTSRQAGLVNPLLITSILLSLLSAGLGGVAIWAYGNYADQKNNVDSKISAAVVDVKKLQSDADEKAFAEREKKPTRAFVGPDDFGRVSFQYPKTWSVYVAKDGSGGSAYEAYLHPGVVPPVSSTTPYAARVVVESRQYEAILKTYESLVKKGTLKSSPVTIGSFSGVRLDGEFTKDRKGSAVIFKIRDKTLTLASDAEAFRSDFDNIILKSLTFNP